MACNRTHVFLGINQINMYLIVLLLGIVLAILFVPLFNPTVKLALLSILLVLILAYSVLVLIKSSKSSGEPVPDIQPCSASSPSYCQECNANPCRCAEILPGQKECPKCRGQLCTGAMQGIQSCGGCGRGYRCPGCLLA